MYTNNAYLNHSTIDRKDKSKPLVVTMCGTYKLYTRPKLPTWRPRGRLDFQLIYIAAGKAHFHFGRNSEEETIVHAGHMVIIPELSEPPVRTLGATIPENESHIFR